MMGGLGFDIMRRYAFAFAVVLLAGDSIFIYRQFGTPPLWFESFL